MIDGPDTLGDLHGQRVPAQLLGVVRIEVVRRVLAVTAAVFDDVLLLVADDDHEVAVLLDPAFGDGLDSLGSPVAVGRDQRLRDRCRQRPPLCECGAPVVRWVAHCHHFSRPRQEAFGASVTPGDDGRAGE